MFVLLVLCFFTYKDPSALSRRDSLSLRVETNGIGACGAEQGPALHFVSTGQYFSSKCGASERYFLSVVHTE